MRYIYKKGHLDENETRKYMRHIVSAVDHLHRAGIIHRQVGVVYVVCCLLMMWDSMRRST